MKQSKKQSSGLFTTLFRWIKRAVFGASMEVIEDDKKREAEKNVNDVEKIVTPSRQALNNFMERKLAVGALCVVILMFLFVFIGPLFMPNYTDTYTEVTQKSIPPCMNLMSIPKELKGNIKDIDSYGSFSLGLSNDGKVYVWGQTVVGTTKVDVADIPEEVLNDTIVMIGAGIDHCIAISESGKVYGWGYNKLGQYGAVTEVGDSIQPMPEELINGTIDVSNIKKLDCGYQCTLILMNDGTHYLWGNKNSCGNMDSLLAMENLDDMGFTLNYVIGIPAGGKTIFTGQRGLFSSVRSNTTGEAVSISEYLNGRSIVEIVPCANTVCYILDDNSLCFAGEFDSTSEPMPTLADGEYFTKVKGGIYHYTGITNLGNVYTWGGTRLNQCDTPSKIENADDIFVGAFQTYVVDENDSLIAKWGLRGYLFGTNTYGADVFQRLVNGGRMTMTIGAIAVIISSIIGILIGCISGYFGGAVDIILMRVAEIFSAIPFLPFAMILSAVMTQVSISENARIAIIMVILGVLSWPGLARLVRGQVLVARENEYVTAAKAMGVKESIIAFKHILPNVISVIIVTLTLDFASCMLTESSLSYLGFGVTYPRPTWGNMLNGANNFTIIQNYWWQWFFPALFLAITTICINIVGDTIRDVMDPKSNIEK